MLGLGKAQGGQQHPSVHLQEVGALAHPTGLCTAGAGEQLVIGDLMFSSVIS